MEGDDQKENILIVDDLSKNIQVVGNILKNEGYRMSFAQSGESALVHIRNGNIDLILLDIMMPGINGYEVCEILKKDPLTKEIPVIFLTAKTDTDSIVKGFEFGAADYVIKPFNSAELLARVSTHLLLKKSREALKNANQQLQELNATKDKFFSIIAHDLRNPFNALIGGSSFLMDSFENLDKEQIRYFIGEMNAAAKNTLNLLENLLAWSRSQTGRMQCSPRRISISDIVSETVELLKNNAEEKELSLLNDVEPENFVYADAEMTKTVVRNLVSNAVKYTAKGGTVKIASKETEAFTEISISDTGIGITEQRMETLFKIDFPHSAKGTAGEQGTGLGLLLCKEFLEKNRGEIEAKSRPGEGSVFSIRLPKEASDETAQITFS